MSNNTGGPAFPQANDRIVASLSIANSQGMTLRDYFAAQTLIGAQVWDAVLNGKNAVLAGGGADKLAEIAYAVADAMLSARGTEKARNNDEQYV